MPDDDVPAAVPVTPKDEKDSKAKSTSLEPKQENKDIGATKSAADKAQAQALARRRKKMKAKADAIAAKRAQTYTATHEQLEKIVDYLRNTRGAMKVYDGANPQFGRRIEYFKGETLVDSLTHKKFRAASVLDRKLTRLDATAIGDQMLAQKWMHRSTFVNEEEVVKDRFGEVTARILPHTTLKTMADEEDALYTWIYPKSNKRLRIQSGFFLIFLIFCCAIKAWPLWLKIFVWWCSTTLLILIFSLMIFRIIFAIFFFMIGFRGMWLLPNIMYDELDFMDAIVPLYGYGVYSAQGKKQAKEKEARLEKERARRRALKAKMKEREILGDEADKFEEEEVKSDVKEEIDEDDDMEDEGGCLGKGSKHNFRFGMLNLGMFLLVAIGITNQLGLFLPENIPDFVITQTDLYNHFPSLGDPALVAKEQEAMAEEAARLKKEREDAGFVDVSDPDALERELEDAEAELDIAGMGESEEDEGEEVQFNDRDSTDGEEDVEEV